MNPNPSSENQPPDWAQQHGDLWRTQVQIDEWFHQLIETNWTLLGMF